MKKLIQFGETVEGYTISVLNEREIRAAAGMLFMLMFISIQRAAKQFIRLSNTRNFLVSDFYDAGIG